MARLSRADDCRSSWIGGVGPLTAQLGPAVGHLSGIALGPKGLSLYRYANWLVLVLIFGPFLVAKALDWITSGRRND